MGLAAILVSFQLPLAVYGAGILPAAAYGGAWRLGVFLCAGMAWAVLCRGRLPPWAAFHDWRLWLGLVSFLDTLLISIAVRLVDPLSALATVQCSPLFFNFVLRWQLGLAMTDGARGWLRLCLACLGAVVAVSAGRQSSFAGDAGDAWRFVAGMGLSGLAALAMALNGFTFGWARTWSGGSSQMSVGFCCLASALGSLLAGAPALAVSGGSLSALASVAGLGLLVGGGQAVFYRMGWFAPVASLAQGGVMPAGPALGALWLLLGGFTASSWAWVVVGVAIAVGAAGLAMWESVRGSYRAKFELHPVD